MTQAVSYTHLDVYKRQELQMELTRGEIPFRITSGIRFFEQAHIKELERLLRCV